MSFYTDWIENDISAAYGEIPSSTIVFRRMVTVSGAQNPVSGSVKVFTLASAGANTVTLEAPIGNWFLEIGDTLTIGTNVATVTARVPAISGKFTNVPLSAPLTEDVTVGQAVSVAWTNDYPVKAIIGAYEASLIDGSLVKVTDTRVMMQASDTAGRVIPRPQSTDKIIIDGQVKSVVTSNAQYAGESVALFDTQARG